MRTHLTTKAGREMQPKAWLGGGRWGREVVAGLRSDWKESVAGGLGKGGCGLVSL